MSDIDKAYEAYQELLDNHRYKRSNVVLVPLIAKSAMWSVEALRFVPDLEDVFRDRLIEGVKANLNIASSYLTGMPDIPKSLWAELMSLMQPEPINKDQATIMLVTLNTIKREPESWNQRLWHTPCGTAHCFAGHTELIVYGEQTDVSNTRLRAREALGITSLMADVLFFANNTMEQLEQVTTYLIEGAV